MQQETRQWKGVTQGGKIGQGTLMWLVSKIDPVSIYWLLCCIVPFYMLFNKKAFRAVYRYFRRMEYPVWKTLLKTYRNHVLYAQCMLDKFSVYMGNSSFFDFGVQGEDDAKQSVCENRGLIIVSSHVGNFELTGMLSQISQQQDVFTLFQKRNRKFYIMVYGGETPVIQTQRQKVLAKRGITLIYAKKDMSHMLVVKNALEEGGIVGITCDRFEGSLKYETCRLLGSEVKFPIHAFAMAAHCRVPILSVFCMKAGRRRYQVYFKLLTEDRDTSVKVSEQIKRNVHAYVRMLEERLHDYPEQWFNFFEFWNK
ncbi:MAG: hypothetical protein NC396_00910 [Bacteroides sp.]|nr:hypothetical protein [Bacteroides sp.]MCM1084882.1 hypothetical protein [Bacteroides sp.]